MSKLSTIQKTTRAVVAAIVIGAASMSVAPAQAGNNNVTFGFSFHSGNGVGLSIGSGNSRNHHQVNHRRQQQCMTNRQVRRGLSDYGFNHIRFTKTKRAKIWVKAVRGGWQHKLIVNRCNGQVRNIKKVRRHHNRDYNRGHGHHGHHGYQGGGGLNLQFNFR